MTANDERLQEAAKGRLKAYRAEKRRSLVFNIVSYTAIACAALLVFLMLAADYSGDILARLGLSSFINPRKGVYADCSLKQNEGKGFCPRRSEYVDERWKALERKNRSPFAID